MLKAVGLQVLAVFVAAALAAVFFGSNGALSAMLGGLACVLPNGIFALRLLALGQRAGSASVLAFVAGELFKLIAIVGLLVLAVQVYPGLHWGALLIGLVLALKANLFAFLVKI